MADPAPTPDVCPDCDHPWSAHAGGTCATWNEGERPCTCKREPPAEGDEDA